MLGAVIKDRLKSGLRLDPTILDLDEVELREARMVMFFFMKSRSRSPALLATQKMREGLTLRAPAWHRWMGSRF